MIVEPQREQNVSGRLAIAACSLLMFLSACTPTTNTKDTVETPPAIIYPPDWHIKDGGPDAPVDVSSIPDAVPRKEERTVAGNKTPYTVLGKTYRVLSDSRGFVQQGKASWYGNKFHGRKTSNGEVYSMYGMTAAHKTLPIPSYVRVTNLDNGRKVVVRVNDRGPFHGDRIIDLTYAAASKLDYLKAGTARVKIEAVEAIEPATAKSDEVTSYPVTTLAAVESSMVSGGQDLASDMSTSGMPKAPAPKNSAGFALPENTFLQAGAFSSSASAEKMRQRIAGLTSLPVNVQQSGGASPLYRVRVGPINDNLVLMDLRSTFEKNQLPAPHLVYD